MKKIPHPWWHWFYTRWVETRYSNRIPHVQWHKFACSKCKKVFEIDGDMNDFITQEVR